MKHTLFLFLLIVCLSGYSQSPLPSWTDFSAASYELVGSHRGIPTQYRALGLDANAWQQALSQAPFEVFPAGSQRGKILLFPYPDGTNKRFEVFESPIVEAGLSQKFPALKTYMGRGIDDPQASLRCNFSSQGFHAIIHSEQGSIYIDPYPAVNQLVHFVYFKNTYRAARTFAEGSLPRDPGTGEPGPLMPLGSGEELYIYRIAISTTGEYATFHGGTVNSALSAIVTTLNRVNSIFERELAIRFVLVSNNDRVVFLNAASDPFTNNDASAILSENQATLDSRIGSSNYDIGHVFSTGSGGLATEGVCRSNVKAYGTTGTNTPIGDPFDVDYVSHEIGHQFGADHTYNSRRGSCQGQRVGQSAYEPGSGSTIMAYAGLCGIDNLQLSSHDYFHTHSYQQIRNYITLGSGRTCGTTMPTGNTPPVIVPLFGNTTIPMMTPFELEGRAGDADGDSLSYCWEQYDLGPSGGPSSPAGDAPIFRSFSPVSSPVRVFPRLDDLVNKRSIIGETLPTYARNLHFRLTARDHVAGGGGVEFAEASFAVTSLAGPFELSFPTGGATIWLRTATVKVPIRWNIANTHLPPVNCDSVSVYLSVDGGYTFPFTLAEAVPNDGFAQLRFPQLNTDSARIKIKARNNIFFAISDENFIIKLDNVSNDPLGGSVSFSVGPNPVSEEIHVQVSGRLQAPWLFELMDMHGRRIYAFEEEIPVSEKSLDVRDLSQGLYFYRISYGEQTYGGKLFIQSGKR